MTDDDHLNRRTFYVMELLGIIAGPAWRGEEFWIKERAKDRVWKSARLLWP